VCDYEITGGFLRVVRSQVGQAGLFGFEKDLDGESTVPFDHERFGFEVVQMFTGDRVGGGNDHTAFLLRLPAAYVSSTRLM
jgi:hypothetical protein